MSYYTARIKNTCKPLGKTYRGYKIIPSEKVYYGEYQYKICFEGNKFHYDILLFSDLVKTVQVDTYFYRLQVTSKNINLYVHDKDTLDSIIDRYQHTDYLQNIHSPIDNDHLESLLDSDTEYVYRNKYWYGMYPIKVVFHKPYGYAKQVNMDDETFSKDFKDFIAGSFGEYRLFEGYITNWYSNYLWLTQEEFDNGYPFLKLSYGDLIHKVQKVKLLEQ